MESAELVPMVDDGCRWNESLKIWEHPQELEMVTPYTNEPENPGDRDNDQYRTEDAERPDCLSPCFDLEPGQHSPLCQHWHERPAIQEPNQEQNKVAPTTNELDTCDRCACTTDTPIHVAAHGFDFVCPPCQRALEDGKQVAPALESWVPFEEFRAKALEGIPASRPSDNERLLEWIDTELLVWGVAQYHIVWQTSGAPLFIDKATGDRFTLEVSLAGT